MSTKKPDPLELAFKKPYASESCITIGRILAEDKDTEYSQDELRKITHLSKYKIVSGLINLEKTAKVIESRPLVTSDYVQKGKEIPIVYKLKKKYFTKLQKDRNEYFR